MSKKYYVYCAYGVNNEILYIGKGSGNRWEHCNSGTSNNKQLNRYYFANGEDESMTVNIVKYFNNESEALKYESKLIKQHKPLFNTVGCHRLRKFLGASKDKIAIKVTQYENLAKYANDGMLPNGFTDYDVNVSKCLVMKDGVLSVSPDVYAFLALYD